MNALLLSLALYHAPVVYQQVGGTPRADHITRIDFDGDLVSNNNWDNAEKFPTPGHAYYEVFETGTHYFIFYAYFHARDYAKLCTPLICHENDLEGAMIMVEKDDSAYGHAVLLQTLAHNQIHTYKDPKLAQVDARTDPMGRSERIAILIEAGGHGIFGFDPKNQNKIKSEFSEEKAKYFIYLPGEQAEDPKDAKEGSFRYSFLSIREEFWNRRDDLGKGRLFSENYDYGGSRFKLGEIPRAFAGEKWTSSKANPPWAWFDSNRGDVKRGDWFLDPAFFVQKTLDAEPPMQNFGSGFSTDYVHHPYL